MPISRFLRSLRHSLRGIVHVLRTEPNMRLHLLAAVAVTVAGFAFSIDRAEWLAVILCVGAVMAMECMNTAIERLADRVSTETHPLLGQAKDAAAAAVVIASAMSLVVACVIFLPKLWSRFG